MHVLVNVAMSADGKLSTVRREQVDISGDQDWERVDQLRANHDAVAVGIGTVLADDPSLTVKHDKNREKRIERDQPANPARIVFDSSARTPADASALSSSAETYILVDESASPSDRAALEDAGATVLVAGTDQVNPVDAIEALETVGFESLMVEGGGELIYSLFEAGVVDELRQYVGAKVLGGKGAPTLVDGSGFIDEFPALELETVNRLDEGLEVYWTVD